jgi:hypothetical protein
MRNQVTSETSLAGRPSPAELATRRRLADRQHVVPCRAVPGDCAARHRGGSGLGLVWALEVETLLRIFGSIVDAVDVV